MKTHSVLWRVLCVVVSVVFVLAGWQITAMVLNTPALPAPIDAVAVFVKFAPELWPHFQISFLRILMALVLGVVFGLPVGLFLGRSRIVGELLTPALYILYPLPKIVILPILLVLMGLGGAPKVALIAITVFFQVVIVMRDAARAIPEATEDSVRALGASRLSIWRHVVLPATLPQLFTTLRVSSSIAIAVLFIAEAFAGSTGLGYFIMNAWGMVAYPRMFAGIIALALLGVIIYEAFDIVERRLVHTS